MSKSVAAAEAHLAEVWETYASSNDPWMLQHASSQLLGAYRASAIMGYSGIQDLYWSAFEQIQARIETIN